MRSREAKYFQSTFRGEIWKSRGKGGWYFISLPMNLSVAIRKDFKNSEEGWGRLKAQAQINGTQWKTSIWYDSKKETYILPLKADIRKKESLKKGLEIRVEIKLDKETWF